MLKKVHIHVVSLSVHALHCLVELSQYKSWLKGVLGVHGQHVLFYSNQTLYYIHDSNYRDCLYCKLVATELRFCRTAAAGYTSCEVTHFVARGIEGACASTTSLASEMFSELADDMILMS